VQRPEHAGHAMHTIFVDDLDALVDQIADQGVEPSKRETYSNGAQGYLSRSRGERDRVWRRPNLTRARRQDIAQTTAG
jgi:hypothetical protein